MDINDLINSFNYKTTVNWKPTHTFIQDLDVIINELNTKETCINLNIYEAKYKIIIEINVSYNKLFVLYLELKLKNACVLIKSLISIIKIIYN